MKAQTKELLPQICLSTVQRSLTGMQLKWTKDGLPEIMLLLVHGFWLTKTNHYCN
jgi:hypothetical protein